MMRRSILLLVTILLGSSCVSVDKYEALQRDFEGLQADNLALKQLNNKNQQLLDELQQAGQRYDNLEDQYDQLLRELTNYKATNTHLQDAYDELLQSKQSIVNSANASITKLDEKDKELAAQRAKLQALQERLDAQANYLNEVKNNIKSAILGYDNQDLSLYEKDGKLYVSLSENLLFAKGSATIDSRGREAIKKIATALSSNVDLNLEVQGHTDSDGSAALNWKLSTNRALSVTHELTKSGVSPEIITASGRAFYDPLVKNDSEANKSKNRRTEIILAPKLDEVFKYLEER